jgi:predicted phage terminase large subunit-like protein
MANRKQADLLRRAGGQLELAAAIKKVKASGEGKALRLHEVIKKTNPEYKFYRFHGTVIKELQKIIDGKNNRLIIQCPPRTGKLIAHETPVLTTQGWSTHGELQPGDFVFHPDGHPVEIVAVSEEDTADYCLHFSNGDTIWCHGNHEWEYANHGSKYYVKETKEMAKRSLWYGKRGTRGGRCAMHIRNIAPVEFPHNDNLIVPPYVLGAWLGDGTQDKGLITHHVSDTAVIEEIESYGYEITSQFDINNGNTKATSFGLPKKGQLSLLRSQLRLLGVENNKHIPSEYCYSSIEQRCELVAGLVDTDGMLTPDKRYSVSNCNKRIIDSLYSILVTLGQQPYVRQSDPCTSTSGVVGKQIVYNVTWWPTIPFPVKLPRKQLQAPHDPKKRRRVGITDLKHEPMVTKKGKCIQVDSKDGLYLVGANLTPTHNSLLSSQLFPAAYLLAHPERNVGLTSYSADLAQGFNRQAREVYRAAGGQLDPYAQAVTLWQTAQGGSCWAVGTGGTVTGRSGHLLVLDDVVKDRAEASSALVSQRTWDWYTSALYTRLEPKVGAIVMLMTRWAEDDLIGRVLEQERNVSEEARENWTIIDLPALYEDEGDRPKLPSHCHVVPDWRTEIGEALCPQRYDTSDLLRIREAVGSRDFASLYQQRPAPEGGNLFHPDWWQFYSATDDLPDFDRVMLSVDCTFTDAKTSDYVVGAVVGQAGQRYYVLDLVRQKLDVVGTMAMISRLYKRHTPNGCLIELAASGHAVYQMLRQKVPGMIGYNPHGKSKVARASGIIPTVEAGNVFLPTSAPWLESFLNEFSLFPASKNDDMVDALSMAVNYCSQRNPAQLTTVEWGRQAKPMLAKNSTYTVD